MGQAEVAITEDTFVSTADDIDHSSESSLRISNVSEGGNNILEIAYLQFSLIPPPAGSYLADLTLEFHCTVISGGSINFHKCTQEAIESNTIFENRPIYNTTPFTSIIVESDGFYIVQLYVDGGYTDYIDAAPSGILAITAELDTEVVLDSLESDLEPSMTLYSPFGLWINPAENPFICYFSITSLVIVSFSLILIALVLYKSVKS